MRLPGAEVPRPRGSMSTAAARTTRPAVASTARAWAVANSAGAHQEGAVGLAHPQQTRPRFPAAPWAGGLAPIQRSSIGSVARWYRLSLEILSRFLVWLSRDAAR